MRTRWLLPFTCVLTLTVPGLAGDGEKPAPAPATKPAPAPAKETPPAKPAAPAAAKKDAKPAAPAPIALARPAPRDLDDAMRRLAHVKVSVAFQETTLQDAIDYIRRVAGFNVIVSPVLQAKGVDDIKPLSFTLANVSLKQLAELIAQFTGTKFKFDSGVLQFTTPQDARGRPVLRIISVADLTMPLHNFPGPDLDLRPSNAEFTPEPESDVQSAWSDPQKIVEMIQKLCGEGTWDDKDVSISADANKLIVRQYPEVQREIARLIGLLRASR